MPAEEIMRILALPKKIYFGFDKINILALGAPPIFRAKVSATLGILKLGKITTATPLVDLIL